MPAPDRLRAIAFFVCPLLLLSAVCHTGEKKAKLTAPANLPPLRSDWTVETTRVKDGWKIELRGRLSPKATREAAAFRAIADVETFDTWPPYK